MGFNSTLPLERFPAATDGQAMADFLGRLFQPESGILHAYYIVMYVAAGGTCLLLLGASGILALRVYRGMMWIVQVYPTSHGSYVIPNSITSLISLLLFYVIVYTAYAFKQIDVFRAGEQSGIFLWRTLIWIPLWSGAWCSAWGTFSSFPDALRISKRGTAVRYLLHPTVWNIGVWGAPLLLIASLLPTIVLAQTHYSKQLGRWNDWKAAFADPGADLDSLRSFGLDIWLEVTRVWWYYSITMWMWCGWALVCLITYFSISLHTLLRIRAQVKIADRKQQELQTFYLFPSQISRVAQPDHSPSPAAMVEKSPQAAPATGLIPPPQQAQPTTASSAKIGGVEAGTGVQEPALYPPLRQQPQISRRTHQVSAASRRSDLLRGVLRNVIVQYVAINSGASCFALAAGGIGGSAYNTSRTNDLAPHQVIWNFLVAVVNILCGVTIIITLTLRSLDGSLTVREEADDAAMSPGQGPSSGNKSGSGTKGIRGRSRSSVSGGPSRALDTIHISPPATAAGPRARGKQDQEIEEHLDAGREAADGLGVARTDSLRESVNSRVRLVSSPDGSTAVAGGSSNGHDEPEHGAGNKSGRSQILGSIKRARASTSASARAQEERALAALVQPGQRTTSPNFSADAAYSPASPKQSSVRRTPSMPRNMGGVTPSASSPRPGTATSDATYVTPFGSVSGDMSLSNSPWLEGDAFAPPPAQQPLTTLGREVLDATRRETSQRSRYGTWRDGVAAPTSPLPAIPPNAGRPR